MWITPFLLRDARFFYPQPNVNNEFFFHRGCGEKGERNYRQELMFAVMSRMLFCMVVSPFFSATSTFRMAYNTVE